MKQRCYGHPPATKHVVGRDQLLAVQINVGKGIQAIQHQLDVLARQRGMVDIEGRSILPVRQADPLDLRLVIAVERIDDQLCRHQIGLHRPRYRSELPQSGFRVNRGMTVAGSEAELPAVVQHLRRQWRGCAQYRQQQRQQHAGRPDQTALRT